MTNKIQELLHTLEKKNEVYFSPLDNEQCNKLKAYGARVNFAPNLECAANDTCSNNSSCTGNGTCSGNAVCNPGCKGVK